MVFVVISSTVWWFVLQITVVLRIELAASQKSAQVCLLISYLLRTSVQIQRVHVFDVISTLEKSEVNHVYLLSSGVHVYL
jgi:hypothetical protein